MYDGSHGAGHAPADRPAVGAGNTLTVTYRDGQGEEVYLTKISGSGRPTPFWQVWEELQRLGVPSANVSAVHSDLQLCRLPGCYCEPQVRGFGFPRAEFSFGRPYGDTRKERATSVAAGAEQAALMARLTGQPAPPSARPAPLPPNVPPAPPVDGAQLGQVLAATFGHDQVQRYHPDELERAGVGQGPEVTLTSAGLPAKVPYLFQAWSVVPVPERLRARRSPLPADALRRLESLATLGGDGHCVIGLMTSGPPHVLGGVWAIDPDYGSTRFVNADTASFARSLALLTRGRQRMRGCDPYTAGEIVERLQAQLAAVDPAAFNGEEHWWPLVVEQMWNGLL
ncbi:SUKH-4 family immunity protein [Spirillospora sp. NBC_01491]|uniref:SUKH-4 family immunity protein n=1 Tax=Spirillospora sp. NBC_01491 TaxID=2976007 RepID=UPI002E3161FF|nr:SUKH-4 family immunity protein [Spirillospora sp. NBC_01491]